MTTVEDHLHELGEHLETMPPGLARAAWQTGRRRHRRDIVAGVALSVLAVTGVGIGVGVSRVSASRPSVTLDPVTADGTTPSPAATTQSPVPLPVKSGPSPAASVEASSTLLPVAPTGSPTTYPTSTSQDRARLAALSLPATLPGYPIGALDQGRAYGPGVRIWGWDTEPGSDGSPGARELRLLVADHAGAFAADVASGTPAGTRQVRGTTAAVFESKTQVLLIATIDGVNLEASGGAGANVDDLIMAVNAVHGLGRD